MNTTSKSPQDKSYWHSWPAAIMLWLCIALFVLLTVFPGYIAGYYSSHSPTRESTFPFSDMEGTPLRPLFYPAHLIAEHSDAAFFFYERQYQSYMGQAYWR